MTIKYIEDFFEEKEIPFQEWQIEHNGNINFIDNEFIIETIKNALTKEQQSIANILRKIDFANGDINHFLKHLAEGYIKTNY
jgi:hypothetical protein